MNRNVFITSNKVWTPSPASKWAMMGPSGWARMCHQYGLTWSDICRYLQLTWQTRHWPLEKHITLELTFANNKWNHNTTQNHEVSVFRTHLYLRSSHKIYGHSWTLRIFSLLSQNSCYSETSSFHHLKNKKIK